MERELDEAHAELAVLRIARVSERESATRVESIQRTLHHSNVAVANLHLDLEVQRGNVSVLRDTDAFI